MAPDFRRRSRSDGGPLRRGGRGGPPVPGAVRRAAGRAGRAAGRRRTRSSRSAPCSTASNGSTTGGPRRWRSPATPRRPAAIRRWRPPRSPPRRSNCRSATSARPARRCATRAGSPPTRPGCWRCRRPCWRPAARPAPARQAAAAALAADPADPDALRDPGRTAARRRRQRRRPQDARRGAPRRRRRHGHPPRLHPRRPGDRAGGAGAGAARPGGDHGRPDRARTATKGRSAPSCGSCSPRSAGPRRRPAPTRRRPRRRPRRPAAAAAAAAAAPAAAPDVSIVVLTHNALAATRRCVASLLAHTGPPHELILVDNGSAADTVAFLRETAAAPPGLPAHPQRGESRLRRRQQPRPRRGARARRGAGQQRRRRHARLARAAARLRRRPSARRSGRPAHQPHLRAPAGGRRSPTTRTRSPASTPGRRASPPRTPGEASPHWRAVGFCVLIRRALLEAIGGLDPRFGRGNFEDDDYALRARLAGYESWIAGDCFVHHDGGRSFAAAGVDLAASLAANWEIFKAKWGLPADGAVRPSRWSSAGTCGAGSSRRATASRCAWPARRGRTGTAGGDRRRRRGRPRRAGRGSLRGGPLRPRRDRLPRGPRRRPRAGAGRQRPRLRAVAARPGGRGPGRAVRHPRPRRVRPGRGVEPRTVPVGARPTRRRGAALRSVPGARSGRTGLRRGVGRMGGKDGLGPGKDDRNEEKPDADARPRGDGAAAVAAAGRLFE